MIRIVAGLAIAAAALLTLVGCGSSGGQHVQNANVVLSQGKCAVAPTLLQAGPVAFVVKNEDQVENTFSIKEDNDTNEVGLVLVHPGDTTTLTVTFDAGDVYVTHCGDTKGRTFKP